MHIRDYKVGAKVTIDDECIRIMENGNKSIHCYPSTSFIEIAKEIKGIVGTVTMRFKPGYDMNVQFVFPDPVKIFGKKEITLHMKNNWINPLDNNYINVV